MSFPKTPVLDDFNRADGVLSGGIWQATPVNMNVTSNRATGRTGTGGGEGYTTAVYSGDVEAYVTVVTLANTFYLYVHWDRSTSSGYAIHLHGTGQAFISRFDNGVENVSNGGSLNFASGDILLVRAWGGKVEVLRGRAGVWTLQVEITDRKYTSGVLGLGLYNDTSIVADDFGGGSINDGTMTPATTTMGETTLGGTDDTQAFDLMEVGGPFFSPIDGYIVRMVGYVSGNGPNVGDAPMRGIVYANGGGNTAGDLRDIPNQRVGYSEDVTIIHGTAYMWTVFDFPTPARVYKDRPYWLGYHGGAATSDRNQMKLYTTGAGSVIFTSTNTVSFGSPPPDPFFPPAYSISGSGKRYSLYAVIVPLTSPAQRSNPRLPLR